MFDFDELLCDEKEEEKEKEEETTFPGMKPGDVFVTLDDSKRKEGKTPLQGRAYLKTRTGLEYLDDSSLLYAKELRLGVCHNRRVLHALEEGDVDLLEEWRQAGWVFRGNPDPKSNFYRVETTGSGTLWVKNAGKRSLRFQTPDGLLYRVCAGYVQPLTPGNRLARIDPPTVVLDVRRADGPVDSRIDAVHLLDHGVWRRGDVSLYCGDYVDSYHLRVMDREDCLGIFEAHSQYFLCRPALEVLDTSSYGPANWYIRNMGSLPLEIRRAGSSPQELPGDQKVYELNNLMVPAHLEQEAP